MWHERSNPYLFRNRCPETGSMCLQREEVVEILMLEENSMGFLP